MPVTVCWFRRDLRLEDNHALWQALRAGRPVLPLFIFDHEILDALGEKEDRRVGFIFSAIQAMNLRLQEQHHSGILCLQGKPVEVFDRLLIDYNIEAVCCNEDYEPYAVTRDRQVEQLLPDQAPAHRLAMGGGLLRGEAARLRPGGQQWQLAVGGRHRLGCGTLLPDIQPHGATEAVRSPTGVHPPLDPRAGYKKLPDTDDRPPFRPATGTGTIQCLK